MELSEIMLRAFAEAIPQKTKSESEFLAAIEDKEERREYFLCLIYRMPLGTLEKLKAQNRKPEEIERERNIYLVKAASDMDPQKERVTKEIEKLNELIKENRQTTDMLKKEVAAAIDRERKALQDQITGLKDQQKRDQALADRYREEIGVYREKLEALQEHMEKQQSTAQAELKELQAAQQNEQLQKRADSIKETYASNNAPAGIFEKHRRRKLLEKCDQEMDEFLQELISKEDLTAEQKDYLISALEEGYSVRIARRVMVPQLSVEQMQKFIKIYEKHMGGKRR